MFGWKSVLNMSQAKPCCKPWPKWAWPLNPGLGGCFAMNCHAMPTGQFHMHSSRWLSRGNISDNQIWDYPRRGMQSRLTRNLGWRPMASRHDLTRTPIASSRGLNMFCAQSFLLLFWCVFLPLSSAVPRRHHEPQTQCASAPWAEFRPGMKTQRCRVRLTVRPRLRLSPVTRLTELEHGLFIVWFVMYGQSRPIFYVGGLSRDETPLQAVRESIVCFDLPWVACGSPNVPRARC